MRRIRPHGRGVRSGLAVMTVVAVLVAGCDGSKPGPSVADPAAGPSTTPAAGPAAATPLALAVVPKSGATKVPVSAEVGIDLSGGKIESVSLTKKGADKPLKGRMRDDGTSWVPASPLAFSTTYTATVTARGQDGAQTVTRTTTFTTMGRPGRTTGTGLYLFDGQTVGVGMPVVVEFHPPVPPSARAAVQRRLFVTSNPPQPGVWHWASGSQVWYRPPVYWQPGTTITVRAGLRGQPTGNGYYGDVDRSATVRVGSKVVMKVDNATKRMKVYINDELARTIPVSLGKPSTPSSSGHMVVMAKHYQTVFDTRGEPNGGYVVDINYAMRITWGGEFIHAAPWSVNDQGRRNVSHGCVNMSWNNAKWLFGKSHVGDPVIVKGTEVTLVQGNGWTAWDLSWKKYIKGSALPVPPDLAAAGDHASDPGATSPGPTMAPATPAPTPGG